MAQNASGAKVTSTFCVPHPAALSVCKGPPVHAPRSVQAEATLITVVANLVAVLVIFHGILSRSLSKMSAYDRAKPTRSYETYFDGTILLRGRTRPRKQLCKERGSALEVSNRHKVFDAFQCWLYTGRVKDPPEDTVENTSRYAYYLPVTVL
jgi:hypothetical protein